MALPPPPAVLLVLSQHSVCGALAGHATVEEIVLGALPLASSLADQAPSRAFPHVDSRIRTGNHSSAPPSRAILLTAA